MIRMLRIEDPIFSIISVGQKDFSASFMTTARFNAHVVYGDPKYEIYDEETGDFFFISSLETDVEQDVQVAGLVNIAVNEDWTEAVHTPIFSLEVESLLIKLPDKQ